ncbi:MAG: response regulator [Lachnospiraceae bacterium]|nr:response regulator [Lachnospiraceae bacterium]
MNPFIAQHNIYMEVSSWCFLILLILINFLQSQDGTKTSKLFCRLLVTGFLGNTMSLFCSWINFNNRILLPDLAVLLCNAVNFLLPNLVSYFLLLYTQSYLYTSGSKPPLSFRINAVILLSSGLIMLGNLLSGRKLAFSQANMHYNQDSLFIAGFVIPIYFCFFSLILLYRHHTRFTRRQLMSIFLAYALNFIGAYLQYQYFDKVLFFYFFITMGLYIIYFSIQTPDYRKMLNTMRELRLAETRAMTASEAKSSFLANMSHEIRTPIHAVLGMNEMILRECNDPSILNYSHNIESAGRSLLSLINDILDISKIESGKMEVVNTDYELSSVLNDVLNMINVKAMEKDLRLEVNVDPTLPENLNGDESRLRQIILNLLSNAVKYTKEGMVSLDVCGHVLDSVLTLRVSVSDTGIGIKPADQKKLFAKFQRLDLVENKTIQGSGLGLAITYNILKLMDGNITVRSTYGEGSTFTITLPQIVRNDELIGNFREKYHQTLESHPAYRKSFVAPDAKILIVDDTPMNITVIQGLLKQTKVQIDPCYSGGDSLERVRKEHYDIILLDFRMPKMDGIQTLQRMKEVPYNKNDDTPTICLTANAVAGAREKYLAAGFTDYLSKPVQPDKLEKMMLKYLPEEKVTLVESQADPSPRSTFASEAPMQKDVALPSWLSSVSEVNVNQGITNTGSVEDYLKALHIFAESIKDNIEQVERFYNRDNWDDFTIRVHAIKSSARIIGAMDISNMAKDLESYGEQRKIWEIHENTNSFLAAYASLGKKLAPILQEDGAFTAASGDASDDRPVISESELSDAYSALRELAASLAYEDAKGILEMLKEYALPEEEIPRLEKIHSALEKLDWDEVVSLLPKD